MLSETKSRQASVVPLHEGRYAGKKNEFSISITLLFCCIIISCSERSTNPPEEELNDISSPPSNWINVLAINSNGDFFAGTTTALYISTNQGSTWSSLTHSIHTILDVGDIIIASNSNLFISCHSFFSDGVFRSTDNGSSWTLIWSPSYLVGYRINPIEIDLSGNIYVCNTGLFRSPNFGNTWELIYQNWVSDTYIVDNNSILIGVPGILVGEILYSTNNGNSWDSTDYHVNVIKFYKYNSFIFAGGGWGDEGGGGVHKSSDGGMSWESCGFGFRSITSFVTNKLNHLFIGTDKGIYFTEDEGTSWQNVLSDSVVTTLMRDSKDYLYAGTNKGTFLRSTDNGITWHN